MRPPYFPRRRLLCAIRCGDALCWQASHRSLTAHFVIRQLAFLSKICLKCWGLEGRVTGAGKKFLVRRRSYA